jgi:hypothetical protein
MPALLVDDAGARQGRDCTYMPDLRRGLTKRRLIERSAAGRAGSLIPPNIGSAASTLNRRLLESHRE